jgi:hypothetical protein
LHDNADIRMSPDTGWLISRRADFWFVSAGASLGLLAAMLVLLFYGDREIDAVDLVLSELHIGATYGAIVQRNLWRRLPRDVVLVPSVILIVTCALAMSGQAVLLTSVAMYAAVWHRGRQSLGVARFYQCSIGGPASWSHERLFGAAIYLPMLASALTYSHFSPRYYEGEPYLALDLGAEFVALVGFAAALAVAGYLIYSLQPKLSGEAAIAPSELKPRVHRGELWVVLAHAVAFGSSYVLGATNSSFLFVLAVHHEVQYLYFTYAVSRASACATGRKAGTDSENAAPPAPAARTVMPELSRLVRFSIWPALGFAGALTGTWLNLSWLATVGMAGLFCHYWLDGRIWTRRALSV